MPEVGRPSLTLLELEKLIAEARSKGASDNAPVYVSSKTFLYLHRTTGARFETDHPWPANELPFVIMEEE